MKCFFQLGSLALIVSTASVALATPIAAGKQQPDDGILAISQNTSLTTLMHIYHVEPDKRDQLAQNISKLSKHLTSLPGFISATVFDETEPTPASAFTLQDGKRRVALYLQWRAEQREPLNQTIGITARGTEMTGIDTTPRIYTVDFVVQADNSSQSEFRVDDPATAINEVTVNSTTQQEVFSQMKARNEAVLTQPGWVSTNIHLSVDGERNVNIIQFTDRQLLQEGLNFTAPLDPGSNSGQVSGVPDLHYYNIISVVRKD